jgi:hypothetical protein
MVGLPSRGMKSGDSVRWGCWCFCSHLVRSVGSQSQSLHEQEEARHQATHTRAARARRHLLDKVVGLADIDKLAIDTNTHAGLHTPGIRPVCDEFAGGGTEHLCLRAAALCVHMPSEIAGGSERSACARTHELRRSHPQQRRHVRYTAAEQKGATRRGGRLALAPWQ